jgi:hypothetical protein
MITVVGSGARHMDWINMYHTISEGMHRNTIPNYFVVYYDVNHICLNYYK